MNKKIFFLTIIPAFLNILLCNNTWANNQPIDQIVAIVNSEVITQSELDKQFKHIKSHLQQQQTPLPNDQELNSQVLEQMINQSVQLQTAKRAGVAINDDNVDQAINNILIRNKINKQQLQTNLAKEHINFSDYYENIRKQLTIEHLLERELHHNIKISEQEVDKYLNSIAYKQENITQYHLKDILITLPEIPSSTQLRNAKHNAQAIIKQLNQGSNFQTLAIANSNGKEALTGGDLGWRRIEEIPSVFANEIDNMQPGDIAGPIRTANGLHILKLVNLKGEKARHFVTETHARHILLKSSALQTDQELQQKLSKLRQQIMHGDNDFSLLAKQHSEDLISANKNGDLGWITPKVMVPVFEQTMNKLAVGEISQPVKSEFGWHLIQVLERRKVDDTNAFQRKQIKKMIYQRRFQEKSQLFAQRMRNASYIKILLANNNTIPTPKLENIG